MSTALLRTKLFIPSPRRTLVERPRVTEKLNTGLGGKLTLVSAPAGFGKSTALSSWAAGLEKPIAWLSLDEQDNDPARFWRYMGAALQSVAPDLAPAAFPDFGADASPPAQVEAFVVDLVNGIAQQNGRRLQLIVDDYHVITTPQVNDSFGFFLGNVPSHLHLTLAGRTDPPWPLARLRARGELTEVRAADLRFTTAETAAFLQDVMNLTLTPAEIQALEERTEGWIAGLQMAALSMRDRDDRAGFISTLSGSHRFIMDYLLEEVLDKQPQEIRDFLLQTSILGLLTPDLCNAVTGRDDSEAVLAYLEQANLFLVPQDDQRRWFRYHHLFADLLVSRQQRTRPEEAPELHRRAGAWYEAAGQLGEAMTHASAANDVERQVQLLADNVLTMAYQGELSLLLQWLERLPAVTGPHRPWVHIAHAWILVFAGRLDQAEEHVAQAQAALDEQAVDVGPGEHVHLAGHMGAIRGYVAGLRGDWQHSLDRATEALAALPEKNLVARGWATLLVAVDLRAFGRLDDADDAFARAAALSRAADFIPLTVDVLWERSELQRTQGKLRAALETCRALLSLTDLYQRRTGRRLAPGGYIHTGIAAVLREWNDLEQALVHAREAVELCSRWGMADAVIRSHIQLARILQAAGDPVGADQAMEDACRAADSMSSMYRDYAGTAAIMLRLAQGKIDAVARWVQEQGLSLTDPVAHGQIAQYTILAYLRVQQQARQPTQEPGPLLDLLERLDTHARDAGAAGDRILLLTLKALALFYGGRKDAALAPLAQTLNLAGPERFTRTFLDMGEPLRGLLHYALQQGIAPQEPRRLLTLMEQGAESAAGAISPDPLTERELEVLRLLPTSLTTVEIAEQLVVAPSTVRTHVKSIYGKLQVGRRADAVRRAADLRLI